ncbi:Reverse transcriptase (RNA-dependent DNA polymerase), partial [Phytophthora infestans]
MINGVYGYQEESHTRLSAEDGVAAATTSSATMIPPNSLEDWHRRFGHLHYQGVIELERSGLVKGLKIIGSRKIPDHPCEDCTLGKISSRPAPRRSTRSQEEKDLVCHADLAGKYQRSIHGNHHMLVIKWLNYTHVYFIKTKDEAVECFRKFLLMIKNREDSRKIRVLRTDNGGEFINEVFNTLCDEDGRLVYPTTYGSTLSELLHTGETTSRSEPSTTPYAKYHGKMPDLSDSHTFGESVTVLLSPEKRSTLFKFRPVDQRGVFVGHDEQRKGYFVYVREGGARIVNTARYPGVPMIPLQEQFSTTTSGDSMRGRPTERTSAPTEDDRTRERNTASFPTALVEELNKSTDLTRRGRSERISSRNIGAAFLAMTEVIQEPLTLEEARRSPQWSEWEKAIRVEIEALRSNGTFTLVTPPAGAHVIVTAMNFKVKRHADGKVERLRARICAQGFQEIYMIAYIDTYAPVARLVSIRVFLAECNQSGLLIRQ